MLLCLWYLLDFHPVISPVPLPKYKIQARSCPPVIIILIPLEWLSPSVLKTQTGPIDRKPTSLLQNFISKQNLFPRNILQSQYVFFLNLAFGGKLLFWRWKVDLIYPPCPRAPWQTVINTNLSLCYSNGGSSRSFWYWRWWTSTIKHYCVCVCAVICHFNPHR